MLELVFYSDIRDFHRDTYEVLLTDEERNLIILGNVIIGVEGKDTSGWRDVSKWFMAAVKEEGRVVLSVLMTPPMNLTLYETGNVPNDAALAILARGMAGRAEAPGVLAEKELGLRFARIFAEERGVKTEVNENQRIYTLTEVNPDYLAGDFTFRPAERRDMSFLPYWTAGFNVDCGLGSADVSEYAEASARRVDNGGLYILEDKGVPVSMASNHRNLLSTGGVGLVYTPPYFRGRGYAGACVARLSRRVLDNGMERCVLYTNLANPVSNSIYQKIGYRPICDSIVVQFNPL